MGGNPTDADERWHGDDGEGDFDEHPCGGWQYSPEDQGSGAQHQLCADGGGQHAP
jgi:hypothetical protein